MNELDKERHQLKWGLRDIIDHYLNDHYDKLTPFDHDILRFFKDKMVRVPSFTFNDERVNIKDIPPSLRTFSLDFNEIELSDFLFLSEVILNCGSLKTGFTVGRYNLDAVKNDGLRNIIKKEIS